MSERPTTKKIDLWTPEDLLEFFDGLLTDVLKVAEGDPALARTLSKMITSSMAFTALLYRDGLEREKTLRQDLRAFVEEAAENLVEFQFEEYGKRNDEVLALIQKRIESINQWRDRLEDR